MEAPKSPKSPRQQSELLPAGLYESRHDIELQSPVTGSFYVGEKNRNFSSPSPPDTPQQSTNRVSHIGLGRQTPVRKYSRTWWEGNWNVAVAHRVWPRVLYITFGFLVMVIWIVTAVSFANEQIDWDTTANRKEKLSKPNINLDDALISLSGSLKSFDPIARNLNVEWSGLWQDNYTSSTFPLANGTFPNIFWPLDIYRDVSTVIYDQTMPQSNSTNATESADTSDAPTYWFRVDNGTTPHIGSIGMHEWDSFETDISFGPADDVSNLLTQPLIAYPFDRWIGSITFVANFRAPGSNDIIATKNGNYTGANVIGLESAHLEDSALNWRFNLTYKNPCSLNQTVIDQYIQQSAGDDQVNVTEWLSDPNSLATVTIPCHLEIDIAASRPPLVQFAAVMAVIVNWTSTLFIFILTCETIIMRRGFMMSGTDLLGVTFTSLFALPSVRLLLPGAPDFGALIDLIGIIPNVIIISLCITAIAITKLNRKRHPDQKDE